MKWILPFLLFAQLSGAVKQIAPSGTEGYYVLAYVKDLPSITPPTYVLIRLDRGPLDYPTAYSTMIQIGKEGWGEGAAYYPVHNVEKVWIYYRCAGCELE